MFFSAPTDSKVLALGSRALARGFMARQAALAALCVLCAGVGAILWHSKSGLGPDSVTYLDVARSVARGRGLTHNWAYWDPVYETAVLPTAATLWPPGYSLAIAALIKLGLQATAAGRLISVASFALLPLPLFGLCRFFLPPRWALVCTGVAMALFPLLTFDALVASEMPFLLLSTACLLATARALHAGTAGEAAWSWLGASAAAGGAFLFRYVGVAWVAAVVLAFGWSRWRGERRDAHPALAIVPAGAVIAGVALRNWMAGGAAGQAVPGADIFWSTLPDSLRGVVGALIGWKDLLGPGLSWLRPVELALLGVLVGLAVNSVRKARLARPGPGEPPHVLRVSWLIAVFLALGLAVTLAGRALLGQNLEARYLTVFSPWVFVLLVGWALRGGGPHGVAARGGAATRWAAGVCLLWAACQCAVTARWAMTGQEGYVWAGRHSPTIAWIRANVPPQETLLTTRGADIAYWSPNPVLRLPRLPHSRVRTTSWTAVDVLARKARARHLVHFFGFPETAKYDGEEFRFARSLDRPDLFPERHPVSLGDGVVYEVGSPPASGARSAAADEQPGAAEPPPPVGTTARR